MDKIVKKKRCVAVRRCIRSARAYAEYIPIFGIVFVYGLSTHKAAAAKFIIFWIVSLTPFLAGALIQPATSSVYGSDEFLVNLDKQFRNASALAFSVSFITPMIYLVMTRLKVITEYANLEEKVPHTKNLPRGIYLAIGFSALLYGTSLLTYTANSSNNTTWGIWKVMYDNNWIYIVYLFSLYFWYVSMLIDFYEKDPKSDYVERSRTDTDDFAQDFESRSPQ
jgi:hypothetical protein